MLTFCASVGGAAKVGGFSDGIERLCRVADQREFLLLLVRE